MAERIFQKRHHLPFINKIEKDFEALNLTERVIFIVAGIVLCFSSLFITWSASEAFTVEVPKSGGTLREGVLGYPRYINPLLIYTESGKDIASLVYSGLFKLNSQGILVPDIAESYTISPDGKTYNVTIRNDVYFHDGNKLNANDVVFTVQKAQDVSLKSPETSKWQGVSVVANDQTHITFTLKNAFAPFIYNLTLGILPKHIWENADIDQFSFSSFNQEPIGSGPYRVESIARDSAGLPQSYTLTAFNKSIGQKPFITQIVFVFYQDEDALVNALKNNQVDSIADLSAETAIQNLSMFEGRGEVVNTLPEPRLFGVFFNQSSAQSNKALLDESVRKALDLTVDRKDLVDSVLFGFGKPAYTPIPENFCKECSTLASSTGTSSLTSLSDEEVLSKEDRLIEAQSILSKAGYSVVDGVLQKKSGTDTIKVSFTLTTGSSKELQQTAKRLQESWKALGADVSIKTFEPSELSSNVIHGRKFEALLFGEVIPRSLDLYPFFHSSERLDPGINISMYSNRNVDKLLEQSRNATTSDVRIQNIQQIEEEISQDTPIIFLYVPSYIYVTPPQLKGTYTGGIAQGYERFIDIATSYIDTERVWPIFQKNK